MFELVCFNINEIVDLIITRRVDIITILIIRIYLFKEGKPNEHSPIFLGALKICFPFHRLGEKQS